MFRRIQNAVFRAVTAKSTIVLRAPILLRESTTRRQPLRRELTAVELLLQHLRLASSIADLRVTNSIVYFPERTH